MTISVKIGDAKTRLSELIAQVEAGEEVVISRGNEPVAMLTRLPRERRLGALFAEVRAARAGRAPTTIEEILDWRDEGRR